MVRNWAASAGRFAARTGAAMKNMKIASAEQRRVCMETFLSFFA